MVQMHLFQTKFASNKGLELLSLKPVKTNNKCCNQPLLVKIFNAS